MNFRQIFLGNCFWSSLSAVERVSQTELEIIERDTVRVDALLFVPEGTTDSRAAELKHQEEKNSSNDRIGDKFLMASN